MLTAKLTLLWRHLLICRNRNCHFKLLSVTAQWKLAILRAFQFDYFQSVSATTKASSNLVLLLSLILQKSLQRCYDNSDRLTNRELPLRHFNALNWRQGKRLWRRTGNAKKSCIYLTNRSTLDLKSLRTKHRHLSKYEYEERYPVKKTNLL